MNPLLKGEAKGCYGCAYYEYIISVIRIFPKHYVCEHSDNISENLASFKQEPDKININNDCPRYKSTQMFSIKDKIKRFFGWYDDRLPYLKRK